MDLKLVVTERGERFESGEVRRAGTAIGSFLRCLTCKAVTRHPESVLYRYCRRCRKWLDRPDPPDAVQ